ncbi:hypothetical protein TNCV_2003651 [Trichonephila clavipes]|nr:hypothetical protein TNCV_2003651 [Trichonephila clavipes]
MSRTLPFSEAEFTCSTASENRFPSDTLAVNTIDQFDLLAGRSFLQKAEAESQNGFRKSLSLRTLAVNTIDQFDLL